MNKIIFTAESIQYAKYLIQNHDQVIRIQNGLKKNWRFTSGVKLKL